MLILMKGLIYWVNYGARIYDPASTLSIHFARNSMVKRDGMSSWH